jgi:hypothetical protein
MFIYQTIVQLADEAAAAAAKAVQEAAAAKKKADDAATKMVADATAAKKVEDATAAKKVADSAAAAKKVADDAAAVKANAPAVQVNMFVCSFALLHFVRDFYIASCCVIFYDVCSSRYDCLFQLLALHCAIFPLSLCICNIPPSYVYRIPHGFDARWQRSYPYPHLTCRTASQ